MMQVRSLSICTAIMLFGHAAAMAGDDGETDADTKVRSYLDGSYAMEWALWCRQMGLNLAWLMLIIDDVLAVDGEADVGGKGENLGAGGMGKGEGKTCWTWFPANRLPSRRDDLPSPALGALPRIRRGRV